MFTQKNILLYKLLAHFSVVAKHCQIKQAAAELGMRQSNLSNEMRLLEQLLNTKLCVRQSHGIKITSAGKQLHQVAIKINNTLSDLPNNFSNIEQPTILKIAVPNMCFTTFQHSYLHKLREMRPDIVFQIISLNEKHKTTLDNADICLTYEPIKSSDVDILFKIPIRISLVTTKHHIANFGLPKSIDDLLNNHHMVINDETAIYDPHNDERRASAKHLDYIVSNTEIQLALIQSENLISFIPSFMIKYIPNIVEFDLDGWDVNFNLYLITKRDAYKNSGINMTCGFIIDIFKSILPKSDLNKLTINPDFQKVFANKI